MVRTQERCDVCHKLMPISELDFVGGTQGGATKVAIMGHRECVSTERGRKLLWRRLDTVTRSERALAYLEHSGKASPPSSPAAV